MTSGDVGAVVLALTLVCGIGLKKSICVDYSSFYI